MRLQLKSDSGYFAISNKLAKQRCSELKLFQTEEITIIQVRGERVSSENRLEIVRGRDQREKELKRRGASREKHEMGFDRAKNRQNKARGRR